MVCTLYSLVGRQHDRSVLEMLDIGFSKSPKHGLMRALTEMLVVSFPRCLRNHMILQGVNNSVLANVQSGTSVDKVSSRQSFQKGCGEWTAYCQLKREIAGRDDNLYAVRN